MAFILQLRELKQIVEKSIKDFNDEEKDTRKLSGQTANASEQEGHAATKQDRNQTSDNDEVDLKAFPYATIPGIEVADKPKSNGEKYYKVTFPEGDERNPQNWPRWRKTLTAFVLGWIAFLVTAASSIDSVIAMPAAMEFGVSQVAETLATGMFLIGFGIGSLLCSPLSELFGRLPVYVGTLFIFGCWLLGAALAPNFAAQIIFRFLAGTFASAPLTVSGGTMSDIFSPVEKTIAFPLFAASAFGAPALGPVIGSYIPVTGVLSWRWTEWIMLITTGLVLAMTFLCMRETLAPRLLKYRAYYYRELTGDSRFMSEEEADPKGLASVLKQYFSRPFILGLEPIVIAFTLYLAIIYIVLFTFLDGYEEIFAKTYGINEGLSNLCFLGLAIGIILSGLLIPVVYKITINELKAAGDPGDGSKLRPETRIIFALIGAPCIPIGLFWMAWTDWPWISIWSPLLASVVIGFGIVTIFVSCYMYTIDAYGVYSASALTFVALVRYLAAGGMTVVGVPMYANLGTHWTLTLLGCISVLALPVPYVLYKFGPKLRERSKYAASK